MTQADPRFNYPQRKADRDKYISEGVFVFNDDPLRPISDLSAKAPDDLARKHFPIAHQASQDFVDAIYDEIHAGYGFTPLLGAGFSVSAGIPIIQQLKPYLQRCICIALGVEDDKIATHDTRQLWNPRTDKWPPLIDRRRGGTRDWLKLMEAKIQSEKRDGKDSWIYWEALGAMAEWRSALFFLSRLVFDRPRRRTPEGSQGYLDHPLQPRLVQPSQSVIDAGWREWMRDKRPSHNHKILASLSGLLRIDVIMTTNFDDLLERAFEASKNPLQVFDVHLMDGLPELSVVSRSRSLVKMHGSTRSLRADYSLDGEPSAEDKRLFAEYLAGLRLDNERNPTPFDEPPRTKKHLFVFGVGATETRTMAFLTNALKLLPDLKIFWVCYTDGDVHAVIDYAKLLNTQDKRGRDGKARLYVLRHTDAGLLLLHLYQAIRKTIPPNNAIYPATTQLSLPPLPSRPMSLAKTRGKELDDFKERLCVHIATNALSVATAQDLVPGVTTVCGEIFRESELEYVCMWIEMNDIHNADELFETIQEMAYYKLGQRDWTPLYASGDHRPRRLEIERLADASSKPYLIFINAREKPGANRDFENNSSNAWLDEKPNWEELERLLADLNDAKAADPNDPKWPRFKVVLLCRDIKSKLATRPKRFVGNLVSLKGTPDDKPKETVDLIMDWVHAVGSEEESIDRLELARNKLHFLHTLVLMQRARHMSIVWSRCSGHSDDKYWSSEFDPLKLNWLDELEDCGLVRRKDGGFIWMHSNLREELRKRFLKPETLSLGCNERAAIQQSIALWYLKLFDATNTPPAVFEAVDHLCFSAAHLIVGAVKRAPDDDPATCLQIATRRVNTARQLLQEHNFLIHTQGYPRASTRRLEYISEFWLKDQWMTRTLENSPEIWRLLKSKDIWGLLTYLGSRPLPNDNSPQCVTLLKIAIAKLQCVTVEIALLIAREIGEDSRAYASMQILSQRLGAPQEFTDSVLLDQSRRARELKSEKAQAAMAGSNGPKNTGSLRENGVVPQNCHERVFRFLLERSSPRAGWSSVGELIKWWFQCGLLGIASRSYREAERSLYRALYVASEMDVVEVPSFQLSTEGWMALIGKLRFNFSPSKEERRASDSYKVYLPAIYSIQEAAHLFVLQADADSRLTALTSSKRSAHENVLKHHPGGNSHDYLRIAEELALRGLILIEEIQDSGVDRPEHDQQLMGHKSRLLQLAGLACRYDSTRKRFSRHAMSMLGDATAALNEAVPLFAHAEYAVIDLRRAQVRLGEVDHVKLYGEYPFEMWTYDRMMGSSIHAPVDENAYYEENLRRSPKTQVAVARELREQWRVEGIRTPNLHVLSVLDSFSDELQTEQAEVVANGIQIELRQAEIRKVESCQGNGYRVFYESDKKMNAERREELLGKERDTNEKIREQEATLLCAILPDLRSRLREITSRATDALRFLDRAEPMLRERRRNVAWTTSYFELRLRAISYLLWASLVQEKTPIPYLGLEAAMRRTETEPDQLLNDAVRMIRVDSYRLAMVILAYASCARALEIRLALDQSAVRLPERLAQMRDNLDHAVRQLEEVIDRRNGGKGGDSELNAKSDVNGVVQQVVENVLERVKSILVSLSGSIEEQTAIG